MVKVSLSRCTERRGYTARKGVVTNGGGFRDGVYRFVRSNDPIRQEWTNSSSSSDLVVNNKLNERNFCGIFLLEGNLLLIFDSKIKIVSLPKKRKRKRELHSKARNETWDETKKKRREKGEERKETVATHRKPRRVTIYRG